VPRTTGEPRLRPRRPTTKGRDPADGEPSYTHKTQAAATGGQRDPSYSARVPVTIFEAESVGPPDW
jgi:hypothetical protein